MSREEWNPQGKQQCIRRPVRRLSLRELLNGSREIILEHQGEDYNLRITRNGKLILTK